MKTLKLGQSEDREDVFTFTVDERAKPKGRHRNQGGHVYADPETVAFETAVAWAASEAGLPEGEEPLFFGDVWLVCAFRFEDKRVGDLSNYVKAVEDALNGVEITFARWHDRYGETATVGKAWQDDKHIELSLAVRDFGDEPGFDVAIMSAGNWGALVSFIASLCAQGQGLGVDERPFTLDETLLRGAELEGGADE